MTPQSRILMARRHAGMSQTQLAQKVGVQRSAVSHWESDEGRNPSITSMRAVANVTGVLFEWLATGRGPMTPSAEDLMDPVEAADAMVVYEPLEMRLMEAFRRVPVHARAALVEVVETMTHKRTARHRREST